MAFVEILNKYSVFIYPNNGKRGGMKKTIVKLVISVVLLTGTLILPAYAAMDYSQLEPKPLAEDINPGITSPSALYMKQALGVPGALTNDCSPVTNVALKNKMVSGKNVGPFKVNGLKPAVEAVERVFAKVKKDNPELYSQLGTAGMLCVRKVTGGNDFSNHSWGTAIDIKINKKLDVRGNNKTQVGLKLLYPYFLAEGFYWGAEFPTEDSMHFEVSKEKITEWKNAGII